MDELRNVFIIFIAIVVLHVSAILFGWYETPIVWIDNIQHLLAGIALAIFFLATFKKSKNKKYAAVYTILFVLIISIIWELLEFVLLTFLPLYAKQFSLYSPTITEALEDIISNLIGGIIFIILYLTKNK